MSSEATPTSEPGTPRTSLRRRVAFRCAAVVFGVALIFGAELACRAFDWGRPEATDDPFVGFESIVPLFVAREDKLRMDIAPGRLKFFAADSFPLAKSERTFRIFCLGGSTVQGRPFSIETSFTTWLQQALSVADTSRDWEVVNCGGVSYASYRLVPILKECLRYEPDLILVCTGHNEFLEDRTYSELKSVGSMNRMLGHSRLYTLLRAKLQPDPKQSAQFLMNTDVDARLDYNDGLQYYRRDDAWRDQVVQHFGNNLRRMSDACEQANVPLVFMLPPSNLSDSPPFKTEPNVAVADDVATRVAQARERYQTDLPAAIEALKAAVRLDERNAVNLYELGRALESAGRVDEARIAFVRARDEDVCPLRMISQLEKRIRDVATECSREFVDLHAMLESESRGPILGDGLLVDHIHPSFRGHQVIANRLVQVLAKMNFVKPVEGWEDSTAALYREHFKSLDDLYFLRGQRTLENLREWARGRGHNLPEREAKPNEQPAGNR